MNSGIATVDSITRSLNQVLELDLPLDEISLAWKEVKLSKLLLAFERFEVFQKLRVKKNIVLTLLMFWGSLSTSHQSATWFLLELTLMFQAPMLQSSK
jgi:hypothetical protein